MSLRAEARAVYYPSVDDAVFFDDFFSDLYDNRIWSVGGTGSLTAQSLNGGVIRFRTTAGASYEMRMNNICGFSAAQNIIFECRGSMVLNSSSYLECGMYGVGGGVNELYFTLDPGATFFKAVAIASGVATTVVTDVAKDSAYHRFKVAASPGIAQFYIDDIIKAVITTNVPTAILQPYVWGQASGAVVDFLLDYVLLQGDRV